MEIQEVIDRRLSNGRAGASPEALIVVGPIGVGKTHFRKTQLTDEYVHIDSADIFHEFSAGDASLDFPDAFAIEIEQCGRTVTREALKAGFNIALETTGHEAEHMIRLIDSLKSVGYRVEVMGLTADREICEARHASRGDNVSSYWAGPIHIGWVISECEALAAV